MCPLVHLRRIIDLLKYPNYELGFLIGEASESPLYDNFFWEIKAGQTVFLEDLTLGEEDYIISNPAFVPDFCQYFESLWESEELIKDKKTVRGILAEQITSLPKTSAIP